jgi:riboflavin kinase/FMN adenylyltransferase
MAIFRHIGELPAFHNTVLTIGTFDGVHAGHRTILNEVIRHAREEGGESVLITFEPHPRKLLFPDQPLKLITPLEDKLQLIIEAGIEHVVVVPFTRAFSELSATEYIQHFLVHYFRPQSIIIGYDHHFGHDRTGNIEMLKQYEQVFDFTVHEIPAQLIEEAAVSSTKIRRALEAGHVQEAAQMLGHHYTLKGEVIHGAKRGRTIGYPTANIHPSDPEQLVPATGVYAVRVQHAGTWYGGMLNIGYNPTVTDEGRLHIEVHIFDFDKQVYGDTLEIAFIARLRDELKFNSLDELVQALHNDKAAALGKLGH